MKIINLISENIKRIKAIDIKPDGSLVRITGRNAQGKSSVLDSVELALSGAGSIPQMPIRRGEKKARIVCKLDNGLIVKRTFTEAGGGTLTVENAEGAVFKSPQTMLDALVGKLTFDPLEFTRMETKKQLETLKGLVGLDFSEAERDRAQAYARRTEINRQVATLKGNLSTLPLHPDVPTVEVSIAELSAEFQRRQKVNAKNAATSRAMQEAADRVGAFDVSMQAASARDNVLNEQLIADLVAEDDRLEREIQQAKDRCAANKEVIRQRASAAMAEARQRWEQAQERKQSNERELHQLQLVLESAVDLDTSEIELQMNEAEATNKKVRANLRRGEAETIIKETEQKWQDLTECIEAIDDDKRKKLAAAKFPIPDLSFDETGVLLNGIPFSQASSAEQLRVSVSIGLASNPKLRVMLIRDGSLLDKDGLELLAKFAEENEAQLWIERVANDGEVGIVIEDGCVAGAVVIEQEQKV